MRSLEERQKEMCERLDSHSFDWNGLWPVGALLHTPGAVVRRINDGNRLDTLIGGLMIATALFGALYGVILGLFAPGLQTLFAAAKIPLILLGTALLCTPTLYIFNSILGARMTFRQTLSLVLCLTAAAGLILAAFAPIVWFFTVSTDGFVFLTFLHVLVFFVALGFGIQFLETAKTYLAYVDNSRLAIHSGLLRTWFVILLLVGFQMAYILRPLMSPGPFFVGERGLFLEFLWSVL